MVLCYSRMMYVEFTVSQTLEHFLGCHLNAFEFFESRVPARIMIDNLRSAVLQRTVGQAPVFHPRYADFARHHRSRIAPCNVGAGHEKGRVEAGVGYVKKNLLSGLDIPDFHALNPACRNWLDTVANVRIHGETQRRPSRCSAKNASSSGACPSSSTTSARCTPYAPRTASASTFETNHYSSRPSTPRPDSPSRLTPSAFASTTVTNSSRDTGEVTNATATLEHPDHPRALLEQRRKARTQRVLQRFVALTARADEYYQELALRRLNPLHHVRKTVALSEIYGVEATARALDDAFELGAFSAITSPTCSKRGREPFPSPRRCI